MFYVFHGDDEYSQRETLASLIARLGDADMLALNTTRLDGGRVSLAELRHACDALPFLAEVRLVICEGLFAKTPPKSLLKELESYLPTLSETTRLVFLESQPLSDNHPILKLADSAANGYAKLFTAPQGGRWNGGCGGGWRVWAGRSRRARRTRWRQMSAVICGF